MSSPTGRNAQRCCDTVGLSLSNLHEFNKELVIHVVYTSSSLPDWVVPAVSAVHELIHIRCNRKSLQMLSSEELDFIIDAVCIYWLELAFFIDLFIVH